MMESKIIRDFSIDRERFSLSSRGGRMHLRSIHPYDEAEYCWAYTDRNNEWKVIQSCKEIATVKGTEEDAAKFMADIDKRVKPLICIY